MDDTMLISLRENNTDIFCKLLHMVSPLPALGKEYNTSRHLLILEATYTNPFTKQTEVIVLGPKSEESSPKHPDFSDPYYPIVPEVSMTGKHAYRGFSKFLFMN